MPDCPGAATPASVPPVSVPPVPATDEADRKAGKRAKKGRPAADAAPGFSS